MRAYCPIERCGWARKRLGKRYRPFQSLIFDSQASQHGHIAPRLIESATRSVDAVSRPDRQLSSHETRRWREPDSNHRFGVAQPRFQDRLTSLLADCPPTEARREREPTPRGCRAPSAGPMVRILFPPEKSLQTFGSAAWERSRTPTRLLHRPPLQARSALRSRTRPDRRDRLPEAWAGRAR